MGLYQAFCRVHRRLRGLPGESVQLERPFFELGSDYGGYAVCPNGLGPDSVVYSFGVGEDISFDLELIAAFGMNVHAFDPTPRSIAWARAQKLPEKFVLHEWGIADYDGIARFSPPENLEHISHTLLARSRSAGVPIEVPVLRLATTLERLGHARVDVLKLDVEGAEYDVIDDLLESKIDVSQLLLEFHHHLEGVPLSRTERSIRCLNAAGYRIFHASPSGREFSFIMS